jgi:organic radical activating enzyme
VSASEDSGHGTLKISEIFASIQGEGPSAGKPATFLRVAGCNLHCQWCDTKYTWDWQNYDYSREVAITTVAAVRQRLLALEPRRLIITGGEPLLQQRALGRLLTMLSNDWVVEVETNGTQPPEPALLDRVNQWNVSPKLSNGGDPEDSRLKLPVLRAFAQHPNAWLKLVVQSASEQREIDDLVSTSAWPKERVLLMPEGQTAETLNSRGVWVTELAQQAGFGTSPRLHVALWNGKRGV